MKTYKAFVTEKRTGRKVVITSDYERKADFIDDLRRNGYRVNPLYVKTADVYDYIVQNTNCNPWDWREINEAPTKKMWWCVTTTVDYCGNVTASITDRIEAVDRPKNTYTADKRNDYYDEWFENLEDAQSYVKEVATA